MSDSSGLTLLWSTYITDKRLTQHLNPSQLINYSRIDVFVASLILNSRLPIQSSNFFLDFDETLIIYRPAVEKLIRKLYPNCSIHEFRLSQYHEWKEVTEKYYTKFDNTVLLLTYDDHAFVGCDIEELLELEKSLRNLRSLSIEQHTYGVLSHFPEAMGCIPYFSSLGNLWKINDNFVVPHRKPLGAILISPKDLASWFKEDLWKNSRIVSPENPFGPSVITQDAVGILPKKEILRHLDSYQHISLFGYPFTPFSFNGLGLDILSRQDFLTADKIISMFIEREDSRLLLEKTAPMSLDLNDRNLALIKANFRRISFISSRYVQPGLTHFDFLRKILTLLRVVPQIRKNLFYLPLDLVVRLILKVVQSFRTGHRDQYNVSLPFFYGFLELIIAFTPIPALIRRLKFTFNWGFKR